MKEMNFNPLRRNQMLKVNDFFCGAGGMGLGFKYAGFRLAGAWDFDKYSVTVNVSQAIAEQIADFLTN